jgi:hypothetical protein
MFNPDPDFCLSRNLDTLIIMEIGKMVKPELWQQQMNWLADVLKNPGARVAVSRGAGAWAVSHPLHSKISRIIKDGNIYNFYKEIMKL